MSQARYSKLRGTAELSRKRLLLVGSLLSASLGCAKSPGPQKAADVKTSTGQPAVPAGNPERVKYIGFDRNDFPGESSMQQLHKTFAFTGYWVTNPPGENQNTWVGKRAALLQQGWGFLVLANGRLDAEILTARKAGTLPAELGRQDAAKAVANARREGFPSQTTLFLDQEEGGRLLEEQAGYLLGWTEAVASSDFRPGVYASGQEVEDSPGQKIDTIQDIRARVKAGHLHEVAIFDALDQCPPAPGCTVQAKPVSAAPDADIVAWQYAQSPRRPEITKSCRSTYASDGNCYAPGDTRLFLDMNVAATADPSKGR